MKMSRKGQSLMMFVAVGKVNNKPATRRYTERWTSIWQGSLYNNHIDAKVTWRFFNYSFELSKRKMKIALIVKTYN